MVAPLAAARWDSSGRLARLLTGRGRNPGWMEAEEIGEDEQLNRSIVEASIDCITLLSTTGEILYMNEAGRVALELDDKTEFRGKPWSDLWPGGARQLVQDAVHKAASGHIGRFSAASATGMGDQKWWDVVISPACRSSSGALVCISRDMTKHKFAEDRIRWAANHDALTRVPNRSLFREILGDAICEAQATGLGFALLLLDLDDFKRVNDTLGHDTGDALLRTFAARLREAVREDDCVARLGGDEFAILLRGVREAEQLEGSVQAIFDKLKDPCIHDGRMLDCHTSIGASLYPSQASERAELMKNADVALYAAKEAGGGTFRLFEAEFRAQVQRQHSMLSLAKDAITLDLIVPYYQPKVDFRTGRLYGFEALLRWLHPQRGLQAPATIEAAFNDFTLGAAISDKMVGRVLRDVRGWLDQGVAFGHVAINASAAEFRRGDFADRVLEQLHQQDIPTHCLQIEVTESVFLGRGAECVERALRTLSDAGVEIALDDFGTGYASLSHLKKFPVNVIKIDRSFIHSLDADAEDAAIVRAVIGLGKSLDIRIVAEGIETFAQSAYLRKFDCEYGQGYLFGAAAPGEEVPVLIQKFNKPRGGFASVAREREASPNGTALLPLTQNPSGSDQATDRNIYIVDDDTELCRSTSLMLSTLGYRCRAFTGGAEFLNQIPLLQPGCILLDIRMDGLTGIQVLSELKWSGLEWPVFVMSGDPGRAQEVVARGASGFLSKPFLEEEAIRVFEQGFCALREISSSAAEAA